MLCRGQFLKSIAAKRDGFSFARPRAKCVCGEIRTTILGPGQVGITTEGVLGAEWDESPDDAFTPPGLIRFSTTAVNGVSYLQDYGSTYSSGNATHHLTMYRASSGAIVFSTATMRWSWGLDDHHTDGSFDPDARIQQATVNILADMGAQPGTLQTGLVTATASSDTSPPFSTITSPAGGSSLQAGTYTITGTAGDGGGIVGAVDVSVERRGYLEPRSGDHQLDLFLVCVIHRIGNAEKSCNRR